MTEATRAAARNLDGFELRNRGRQRFKNIKESVAVYRALREGEEREGLPIDPVCRMAVDPSGSAGTLTYGGREYHFCSMECVKAFADSPEEYVG